MYSVRYVHPVSPSDQDLGPEVQLPDSAFSDTKALGRALRERRVLSKGTRVKSFRAEGDKVHVFPALPGSTTYWHCVTLTKLNP